MSDSRPAGLSSREQAEKTNKVEVVSLSDMKKEYALVMAKLKLVREIPTHVAAGTHIFQAKEHEVFSTIFDIYDEKKNSPLVKQISILVAFALTPRETQVMLLRRGYQDMATSLGLLYQLDLDIVFNSLVDSYLVALSSEQK